MRIFWQFPCHLSLLFPLSCAPFLMYVLFPFLPVLPEPWWGASKVVIPFCVSEAWLVVTLAALLFVSICNILQVLLVIQVVTGVCQWAVGFLLQDLFLVYFGQ